MSLFRSHAVLWLLAGALVGCQTTTPEAPEQLSSKAVSSTPLRSWIADGSVAAREGTRAQSASFHWEQHSPKIFQLRFFGTLGAGAYTLNGTPQHVTWTNARGEQASAPSAEVLMQQQLHWSLPLSSLQHWIQGQPIPHHEARVVRDSEGLIRRLIQDGWVVDYANYRKVGSRMLPGRLNASKNLDTYARLIIRWQEAQ